MEHGNKGAVWELEAKEPTSGISVFFPIKFIFGEENNVGFLGRWQPMKRMERDWRDQVSATKNFLPINRAPNGCIQV